MRASLPLNEGSIKETLEAILDIDVVQGDQTPVPKTMTKDEHGLYNLPDDFAQQVALYEDELSGLVEAIDPSQTNGNVSLLTHSLYHAIILYGDKRRKIVAKGGIKPRYFTTHPLHATALASKVYDQAEVAGDRKLEGLLTVLYHDVIEERVERRLKSEAKSLNRATIEEEKLTHLGDFDAVAREMRGVLGRKIPAYEGDLEHYRSHWLRGLTGNKADAVLEKLAQRGYAQVLITKQEGDEQTVQAGPDLVKFFQEVEVYVPKNNERWHAREDDLILEELLSFTTDLRRIAATLDLDSEQEEILLRRVPENILDLTRRGSDDYYASCAKVYKVGEKGSKTRIAVRLGKNTDRYANTLDLDHREPVEFPFRFEPSGERQPQTLKFFASYQLDPSNIPQDPKQRGEFLRNFGLGARFAARKYLETHGPLDLVTLLDASTPEKRTGLRYLDAEVYWITKRMHDEHRLSDADQRRAKTKTHLSSPDRLHQLYKNIILLTQSRLSYQGKTRSNEESKIERLLLEETHEQTIRIIEGVFARHCLPGSSFNLGSAREIWKDFKAYCEQGGLTYVSEEKRKSGPQRIQWDGLLSKLFDQRVRGGKAIKDGIYRDKALVFAAALALNGITRWYLQEPRAVVEGIGPQGLTYGENL